MRISKSCELLADGNKPVTDVYFESGFNNISNFNRRFQQQIAQSWLTQRCQLVFLTCGSQGARVFSRQHEQWSIAAQSVKIADTVGAGDTFQAALIAWLTEHELDSIEGLQQLSKPQIDALLDFACRAAALTCSKTGPDLPYREQLL